MKIGKCLKSNAMFIKETSDRYKGQSVLMIDYIINYYYYLLLLLMYYYINYDGRCNDLVVGEEHLLGSSFQCYNWQMGR